MGLKGGFRLKLEFSNGRSQTRHIEDGFDSQNREARLLVPLESGDVVLWLRFLGLGCACLSQKETIAESWLRLELCSANLSLPFHLSGQPTEISVGGSAQPISVFCTESYVVGAGTFF